MKNNKITNVVARRVLDSRGNPTIETELFLPNEISARAIAPSGASSGKKEAIELRDNENIYNGLDVSKAIKKINTKIKKEIVGKSCLDQESFDELLISIDGTINKSKLGGNSLIALSLANLKLSAKLKKTPLFKYLSKNNKQKLIIPRPEIQIFGGGAHAQNSLSFQDFLIYFPNSRDINFVFQSVHSILYEIKKILLKKKKFSGYADEGGFWPNFKKYQNILEIINEGIYLSKLRINKDVSLSIDFAANQFFIKNKYNVDGKLLTDNEYTKELLSINRGYNVTLFEDPYAETEIDSYKKLHKLCKNKFVVIGDDLTATNEKVLKSLNVENLIEGIVIKPNQCGTITETIKALNYSREKKLMTILSARSGDTEESFLSHLAVGWQTDMIKVGSLSRSERTAKWNELLRIKEKIK